MDGSPATKWNCFKGPTPYLELSREDSQEYTDLWHKTASTKRAQRKRLLGFTLVVAIQLALIVFAAIGVHDVVLRGLGKIKNVPTLSLAQVRDSAWIRPRIEIDARAQTQPDRPEADQFEPSSPNTDRLQVHNFVQASEARSSSSQHLLILSPLSNAAENLPILFSHLDRLTHPRCNTSLGFLVSDSTDNTGNVLREHVDLRLDDYRRVTLLQKDFNLEMPSHSGRHQLWAQGGRRAVMAKARTTLLMSTLEADVDWVLWIDSDVEEISDTLFEDMLYYGNGGASGEKADEPMADVIAANVFKRRPHNKLQAYDLNNWSETPESRRRLAKLRPDKLLVEGSPLLDQRRAHLVEQRIAPNVTLPVLGASISSDRRPLGWETSNLYDPESPAYVGKRFELDGVGGVTTLVRAEAHRLGAVFPSWLENHELETEGFGVMAKKVGARVVGLPNYVVLHAANG